MEPGEHYVTAVAGNAASAGLSESVVAPNAWLVGPDQDVVTIYRHGGAGFLPPVRFEKDTVVTTPLVPDFELPPIARAEASRAYWPSVFPRTS